MNTTTEDAIMQLVDQYEPLINKLASKYIRLPRITREDLCQEGRIATYNAILAYDESYGTTLKTFIYTCVQNAMVGHFQSNAYELHSTAHFQKYDLENIKQQESHLVSIDKDFGDGLKLSDTIPGGNSPVHFLIENEENDMLAREIAALSPKERFVLENSKLFMGDMTLEELGSALKVTKQRISQILKKVVNKIKTNLQEVA